MTSVRIEPVQDKAEERQLAGELERYQEARAFVRAAREAYASVPEPVGRHPPTEAGGAQPTAQ